MICISWISVCPWRLCLTGSIAPGSAREAIDWELIGSLFGVFVLGHALVESGWLGAATARLLSLIRGTDLLLIAVMVSAGLGSAPSERYPGGGPPTPFAPH